MAPLSRGSPAPPSRQARAVPRRGRGAAVRTAGGGRVGKRAEGRRGGRGAPGNGPRPRRPLKGPLRAPGPDSKANGRPPARPPSRAAGGARWGGGPQPPRAVWEGVGASRRERGAGWGSPGGAAPVCPRHRQVGLGPQTVGGGLSPTDQGGGAPESSSKGWWYSRNCAGDLEDFLEEVASKLRLGRPGGQSTCSGAPIAGVTCGIQ